MHCIPCASFNLLFIQHKIFLTAISRFPSKLNDSHRMQRPVWRKTSHKPHSHIPLHYLSPLACARVYFEHSPVPNCSYKVYQFVRQPMLHHLDRLPSSVRFGLLPLSFQRFFEILLFVLQQQPGRPADRQPGKPTGCRHCKLSFAFASCSNASSAAADAATAATAQLLAMVKRCSSQSRVAASHRIASHRVSFVRCAAVFTFSLSPVSPFAVSHVAHLPHLVSGGASGAFSFFVMLAARQLRRWLPSFQTWNNIKNFYSTSALYVSCSSVRLSVYPSVCPPVVSVYCIPPPPLTSPALAFCLPLSVAPDCMFCRLLLSGSTAPPPFGLRQCALSSLLAVQPKCMLRPHSAPTTLGEINVGNWKLLSFIFYLILNQLSSTLTVLYVSVNTRIIYYYTVVYFWYIYHIYLYQFNLHLKPG